jgi:hypothetical protein
MAKRAIILFHKNLAEAGCTISSSKQQNLFKR